MKNWSVGLLAAGAWLLAGCDGGAMPAVGADDDGDVGAVAAEPEGDVASLPAGDERGDVESSVPAILLPEPLPRESILLPEPLPEAPIGPVPCVGSSVVNSPNPCVDPPW